MRDMITYSVSIDKVNETLSFRRKGKQDALECCEDI